MRRLVLISNRVMHYRVPVYNYFKERFEGQEWEFMVRANEIQKENPHKISFDLKILDFKFEKYRYEIERLKPDVVILFLHLKDKIFWPLLAWLKVKKIPVIFWTKGGNLDLPQSKVRWFVFNIVHSVVDAIILYSKYELEMLWPNNKKKVYVANNTLNFHSFPKIVESKDEIKREYNIPFEKVVLSVGRMGEENGRKKLEHLISVFKSIKKVNYGLVIVGSGGENTILGKMNLKNTMYLGEIHDEKSLGISKMFKMADVFCVPGHIGLSINQAMYWGLPVVTEKGLQPPEFRYLVNGRNGFAVEEGDIDGLREKILMLLENENLRREFSRNGREDIEKNGSIEGMFNGFRLAAEASVRGREGNSPKDNGRES